MGVVQRRTSEDTWGRQICPNSADDVHIAAYRPPMDLSVPAKMNPTMAKALLPTTCHDRSLYLPEVMEMAMEIAPASRYLRGVSKVR